MAQDLQQLPKMQSSEKEIVVSNKDKSDEDSFKDNKPLPAFVGVEGWPAWFKWFLLIVGITVIGVFLYFWIFK